MWKELYTAEIKPCARLSHRNNQLVDGAYGDGFHTILDPSPVGDGRFNTVYAIGSKRYPAGIVKIPKDFPLLGCPSFLQLQGEVTLLEDHNFRIPLTTVKETTYKKLGKTHSTGIIAAHCIEDFSPLYWNMFQNLQIKTQFLDLLEKNDEFIQKTGCGLDRMGYDAAIAFAKRFHKPLRAVKENLGYIPNFMVSSNVVVLKDGSLLYLDSNLLHLHYDPSINPCLIHNVNPNLIKAHRISQGFVDYMVYTDLRRELLYNTSCKSQPLNRHGNVYQRGDIEKI